MGIIGAILGDVAGVPYEFSETKPAINSNYPLFRLDGTDAFSDDTVMSIATMLACRCKDKNFPYKKEDTASSKDVFAFWYKRLGRLYPMSGYGAMFYRWLAIPDNKEPEYASFGNGSAMRCSYIGEYYKDLTQTEIENIAKASAQCTHGHPEGIKGAVVTAVCIWMAENHHTKEEILAYATEQYPSCTYTYGCDRPISEYHDSYTYNVTCQGSVPFAIRAFYETDSFEQFMRLINSIQCDTDTIGAIGGAICDSYYGHCMSSREKDLEILSKILIKAGKPEMDNLSDTVWQTLAIRDIYDIPPLPKKFSAEIKQKITANKQLSVLNCLMTMEILPRNTKKGIKSWATGIIKKNLNSKR